MDVYAPEQQDQATCPFCNGTGLARGLTVDRSTKTLRYVCESCKRSWCHAQPWADQAWGRYAEPRMIREQKG